MFDKPECDSEQIQQMISRNAGIELLRAAIDIGPRFVALSRFGSVGKERSGTRDASLQHKNTGACMS